MNEARKKVIRAEAYCCAYEMVIGRAESYAEAAIRYKERADEEVQENPEINKKDTWNWQQAVEYEAQAEIYQEVAKAILK